MSSKDFHKLLKVPDLYVYLAITLSSLLVPKLINILSPLCRRTF
jgi:hypothetical protein